MRRALDLIKSERYRQMNREGWSHEHDDAHTNHQLARAAACYLVSSAQPLVFQMWPWDWEWWKPTPDSRIRELVKAGALVVAEIERLQRLQKNTTATMNQRKI